jgi:hypothetical protein
MQKPIYLAIIAILVGTAFPRLSSPADGAWKMPSLNPFTSKGKAPTAARVSDAPTSGWHMPKLWPKAAPARRKANQPTTWNKMTGGTQKLFSKTADAINPWDDKPSQPPPKVSGSNTVFTHNHAAKQEPKSSSINPASWWSTDKKEASPKSVNDFLSQPRPH